LENAKNWCGDFVGGRHLHLGQALAKLPVKERVGRAEEKRLRLTGKPARCKGERHGKHQEA
jgi:hypothetical protein